MLDSSRMDTSSPRAAIGPETSTGLLRNLAEGPDAARWPEFAQRYDPVVRRFLGIVAASHPSVKPEDADDLVQETMLSLAGLFPRGGYRREAGRFRDFLFGVVRKVATKASSREIERRRRESEAAEGAALAAAGRADSAALRAEAEALWRAVVDRVFAAGRWSDKAKAVFVRTELGEPIDDVAREYGMKTNAVHQLRHRASRRVDAALRELGRPGGELSDAIRKSGGSIPAI